MQDSKTVEGKHYCVRSVVLASYKKDKYDVSFMIHKDSGKVCDAKCHCKLSAMGRCSHLSALLYAILDFKTKSETENLSCTSKLCTWNTGRKRKQPVKASERQYTNKTSRTQLQQFNSCPLQKLPTEKERVDSVNKLLSDLKYKAEKSATSLPCAWELLLENRYEGYALDNERRIILAEQVTEFQKALSFGANHGPYEVCEQNSPEWHKLRKFLISASIISEYVKPKTPIQIFKLVKKHLWYHVEFNSSYLQYGKDNEPKVRDAYKAKYPDFEVLETGMWINDNYPGLGASPYGLVYNLLAEPPFGLLEIKCPKVLENFKPTDLHMLSTAQRSAFCSNLVGDQLSLKVNHKYYLQVQLAMAILERLWCDFVIWTPQNLHVQRIDCDESLVNDMVLKAIAFHTNVLAPEYFEMRIPRKLLPFQSSAES